MAFPSLPGAPIGPDIPTSDTEDVYDHIPALHELLPNAGWPGVVYAQVCVHNVKLAADRSEKPANLRPIRGTTYYSIRGPQGEAQMALVGCGRPIPGASPDGGARYFYTDGEVAEATGLEVINPIWFCDQDASPATPVRVNHKPAAPIEPTEPIPVAARPKNAAPAPCGRPISKQGLRLHIKHCAKCQEVTGAGTQVVAGS